MGGIVLLYGKRVLLNVDDQYTQYGFGKSAKCDIGVGQVKMRLAILSLDPETKGDILETSTSETMLRSFRSTFPRPTTSFFSQRLISGKYVEGIKCSYPIYEGQRKVDIGHVRVIQSSTWKVVVRGCRGSFLLV